MARRNRSFLFDNISKRLVQNTDKTAKEINTRVTASTTANTDILTKAETEDQIENLISNSSISTLSDVSIANVASEQVLQYNANTGNWENETLSLVSSVDGLTDTNLSNVQQYDYLKYDGSNWINSALDLSSYVTDTDIAAYSNTAQMNTAIAASNTAMKNYVDAEVSGIINSAPTTLDTLNELAAALGDDPNFATTTATNIGTKLAKSSNLSDLTNAATARTNLGLGSAATTASTDYATSAQGTKADTAHGWGNHATAGYGTSSFSGAYADLTGKPSLFSGAYADLTGKPTIPTNNNQLTNGAGYITGITSSMVTTALGFTPGTSSFSGSYNDLSNKPTIPTNNNQLTNGAGYITSSSLSGYVSRTFEDSSRNLIIPTNTTSASGGIALETSGGAYLFQLYGTGTVYGFLQSQWGAWDIQKAVNGQMQLRISGTDYTVYHTGNLPTIPTNNNQLTNGAGYTTFTANQSLDTGSDVTHAQIHATNWFRNDSAGEGLYNTATQQHFFSPSSAYWHINSSNGLIFYSAYNATAGNATNRKGYVYFDANGFGLLHSGGGWAVQTTTTTTTLHNSVVLNSISEAPSEWNPVLLEDGGIIKKDSDVAIHGAGYLKAVYLNTTHSVGARTTDTVFYSSYDDYIRKNTAAGFRSSLGLSTVATSGSYNDLSNKPTIPTNNNQLTNGAGYITSTGNTTGYSGSVKSKGDYVLSASTLGSSLGDILRVDFVRSADGWPEYGTVISARGYTSGGGGAIQFYAPYGSGYGGSTLQYRLADYSAGTSNPPWTSWKSVWDSSNDGSGSGLDADLLDGSGWLDYTRDIHANQVIADDWLRTTGNTGWYNNTYAGGWYMTDTTWIRTYNNKSVYQNAGTLRTDGTLQVGGSGATFNAPNGGTVTISGSTAWHAGNDGSGSGLDADTVDGIQGGSFLRSDASDSFTGQLTMSTQKALIASDYGHGVYGVYSASKYQHVWSMGTAYNAPANGASTGNVGNLYGLAWTYNPNYGGAGNNAQAKDGLNHQLLLCMNGITYTALGNGIWTSGSISRNGNTVWDAGNDGSGSGLDADTVDGVQGGSFLRSDADDTWSGNISTTSSNGIRFGNANQSDANDGYIAAGKFASGLNIVGTQTVAGTGRQVRIWGSVITDSGNGFWHAGNDGSGSGLDADLLDGQHASSFVSASGATFTGLITTKGNTAAFTSANDTTLSVRSSGTSTAASMSFHRPGAYAVNFGLDTDNHFKLGGWSMSTVKHTWQNSGTYLATGDIYAYYSDERLKTKQGKIENAIDKVNSIETFYYTHNDLAKEHGFEEERMHVGVSAQTVEKVMPEVVALAPFDNNGSGVSISGENYKTVQYEKLVPLLIEAIKEQQAQIEELKEKLK